MLANLSLSFYNHHVEGINVVDERSLVYLCIVVITLPTSIPYNYYRNTFNHHANIGSIRQIESILDIL